MCPKKPNPTPPPAQAPAPPLVDPDVPEIGQSRRRESRDLYGQEAPNYRVKRKEGTVPIAPTSNVTM